MGTSKWLAPFYDMQAQHQAILTAASDATAHALIVHAYVVGHRDSD